MNGTPARLALLATALMLCALLAVQLFAAHRLEQGQDITFASRRITAAERERANAYLEDAKTLSASAEPDIYRSVLFGYRGDRLTATRILLDVVEREPENVEAWGWLEAATRGRDEALNARARARIRVLNPAIARSRARR